MHDFLASLGGLLLAVVPLRLVLVPAEVPGLTRTDVVLAMGIFALVSVAVARLCRDLWRAAP